MSGHSKWSTIKRQKGAADAKRGALFTKLGKEITIAARQGGGDPEANYRLRLAVDKARTANMPADNIKRAIERAGGGDKDVEYEEIVYEGYGPGGVALIVETATDNKNRTAADVRSIFSKAGGQLAGQGSVAWQFEQRGVISVEGGSGDPDDIALAAIDAGATDVDIEADPIEISTDPSDLMSVQSALEAAGIKVESAEMAMVATTPIEVEVDKARSNLKLIEALEDSDDVQRVTANFELPDEILAEAAGS
jgi:YebC/PmpR family DNA-binding regulatory protein